MDAQKVDMFIMANGKYFAEEKISFIRTKLLELDDSKWAQIKSSNLCSFKKFYILSTIIYAIACAWVIVAYCTEGQSGLVVCPSKLIYHIPCPGCGMTRATLLVIHGHWADAIRMNPNVVICMVGIIIFPILLVADMAKDTACLHQTYQKIEHLLHKRLVISLILLFELAIMAHNYICGI